MRHIIIVLTILSCYACLSAQDTPQSTVKPSDAVTDDTVAIEECNIVFCETDTKKCLIFDGEGSWLRQVRYMQIAMRYPERAYVALKMYDGLYEPSEPVVKKMWVKKIVSVSDQEFQKMIDELNSK